MIASKTLYLNADRSKVVNEGDKDAQFLLVREGQELADSEAEKYGVSGKKSESAPAKESAAASPAPGNREEALPNIRTRTPAKKSRK